MLSFNATIYKEGMNYVVDVPRNREKHFQNGRYIPVRGTINQENFKGTLIPRKKERHVMFINRDIRTKIDKSEYDEIEIHIEYDPEPRDIPVPEDVELILSEDTEIYNSFLKLSTSHRRELILYITDARKAETRLKRIQRVEEHLKQRTLKKK